MAGGSSKNNNYADRIIARAKKLHAENAFEPASSTLAPSCVPAKPSASAKASLAQQSKASKNTRTCVIVFGAICALIAGFSLLLPYYGINSMGAGGQISSISDVLDSYSLWFQMNVLPLFDNTLANKTGAMYAQFLETHDATVYTLSINRLVVTLIVIACGCILALSGLLFQSAFKNPLATPSMLGVSDGVTLGCIIFGMQGFASIGENPTLYLGLVYGLGAVVVVAVLFAGRVLSGGARYNILDMLLLGTVVCQLLNGVNSFVQNFVMDENQWYNFYDVQQAGDALCEPVIQGVFVVVFLLTFVPALILRFRFNLISFSNDEGTMMGVRAGLLRGLALFLGSVMQLCAIATIGQVAMLSLAVPFLVRYMFPANFKSQFLGNCLVGCAVLLACVAIQHFATVGIVTMPVGTIVSIFIVPFFIWMMALGKARW